MSDIVYLRSLDPPITPSDVGLTDEAAGCFNLYRVNWKKSFLSSDGARMLCWYQAPDAESARIALRRLKANTEGVWAGTVVGGDDPGGADATASSFTAELRFSAPFSAEALDALAAALRQDDVMFVRGFMSSREPIVACILQAASEQAVRSALERAPVSAEAVWQCTPITPAGLGSR